MENSLEKLKRWMDVTILLRVAFARDKYTMSELSMEAPGSLGQNSFISSTVVVLWAYRFLGGSFLLFQLRSTESTGSCRWQEAQIQKAITTREQLQLVKEAVISKVAPGAICLPMPWMEHLEKMLDNVSAFWTYKMYVNTVYFTAVYLLWTLFKVCVALHKEQGRDHEAATQCTDTFQFLYSPELGAHTGCCEWRRIC